MPDTPLTCQWCRNSPVNQLIVIDWPAIGRRTSLICDRCGEQSVPDTIAFEAVVWRYRLVPIEENADA